MIDTDFPVHIKWHVNNFQRLERFSCEPQPHAIAGSGRVWKLSGQNKVLVFAGIGFGNTPDDNATDSLLTELLERVGRVYFITEDYARTVDACVAVSNVSRKWYVLGVAWRPGSGWKINALCWTKRTNRSNCLLTFSFVHVHFYQWLFHFATPWHQVGPTRPLYQVMNDCGPMVGPSLSNNRRGQIFSVYHSQGTGLNFSDYTEHLSWQQFPFITSLITETHSVTHTLSRGRRNLTNCRI